ncbi:hypothetical protein QFC22_004334 [Naganishia vaughanmartiniae]|uniref:Uncharacterized protein n=1 Tax=Naganishia vaughanmartiniae TaxID=1424756 RepID=A0ACC2X236_9TREE|nr:hypothetical protein QFC22_004334 [Naganishia vaughanmartiniae]
MVYQHSYLPEGVLVPTLCFFKDGPKQEVDLETVARHAVRLAKAGVVGLAVHGTTGEPLLLSREERRQVLKATRDALDQAGYQDLPIIAGCGVTSTWETIDLCQEAATLGASFAMVVAPGYYKGVMSDEVLEEFFTDVADASPIPIVLYNFPGIANGIDLELDLIKRLAKHKNIVGIKLSCGSVSKGARLQAVFDGKDFGVYGGLADTMLHNVAFNGTLGAISGLGNIAPASLVKVFNLYKQGKFDEAKKAQEAVSIAGELEIKGGVPGMRYGVVKYYGYGGISRKPLPEASEELKKDMIRWLDPLMSQEDLKA